MWWVKEIFDENKTMKTLTKYVNRYRTLKVDMECFPEAIDVEQLKFYGHFQGERINRIKGMTLFDFESIVFVKESINAITRKNFIQCVAFRDSKKVDPIFIVLELKK